MRPPDVAMRESTLEALNNKYAAQARADAARALGDAMRDAGHALWHLGYFIGSDRARGSSPGGFGSDLTVAIDLEAHVKGAPANALVFTSPSGAELRSSNFARRVFHPAVERCQALDPKFPSMVFHDLRRTAVTLAISTGQHVKIVQQIAGHSSAVTTLDVYTQLLAHDVHASARAVDALLTAPAVAT